MSEHCGNCRFFHRMTCARLIEESKEWVWMACRRNAPTGAGGWFPPTREDGWCGEWQAGQEGE